MPRQPAAAWPGIRRCSQIRSPGWSRAVIRSASAPHPKLRSAVVVIVEADGALLFRGVGLVHVERDLAPRAGHRLVRDHFLVLLDGVALGRLDVQLAQRSGPL